MASKRSIAEVDRPEPSAGPAAKRRRKDAALPLTSDPSRPPPFQQPHQLLSFSYTSLPAPDDARQRVRTLEWNNSSMRYLVPPPPSADLAYGYERWIKRPEERGRLDGLLEACLRKECEAERARASVVTWRGVVTKILTSPYEDRDGYDINVMCVDGTLYLEEHLSDEKLREKSNLTGKHRLMTYYGYAFESYCTADTPPDSRTSKGGSASPGWGGDVDTNVQWCSVVKTKLGNARMILGGEVDCVRDRHTGQPDTFVELKTSMAIRPGNRNDESKFEKKLLKFYFQSFLLGVPEVIVGFRTPSGHLQTLQSFKTMDIPRNVRGKAGAWDPSACLTWATHVFEFLHKQTAHYDASERAVWRVTFTPRVGLSMHQLDHDDVGDVTGGEDRVGFLPQWYWDRLKQHPSSAPKAGNPNENVPAPTATTGSIVAEEPAPRSDLAPNNNTSARVSTGKVHGWQI
ncbi:RAI1 like PD-XK nuclease-domain-containing protein [Gautieria morchelliformis]|nr:RAI1 like PD-XK nuclease-domain-containing protein [Gautieria morchelliformis]